MLRLGRCRVDVAVRTLMMIDSLEMTDADRALIVDQCRQAAESRMVITHGTDTMVETATALAAALHPESGKTIVLTGAMIPYAFGSSDGLFNLGSALSFVQALPAGRLHRDERPVLRVGPREEEPRDGRVRTNMSGLTHRGTDRGHRGHEAEGAEARQNQEAHDDRRTNLPLASRIPVADVLWLIPSLVC